jgi:hypothetical protein
MTPPQHPSAASGSAPPVHRTLRRLFLTLFLRGRSSRGLQKSTAPRSVASKLALTLVFYAIFGALSLGLKDARTLSVALYLHALTLVFLGMFIASSSGEVLFNKEEADILLSRPVTAAALLRAKVRVLVEVSLWIAMSFNLLGFLAGVRAADGSWLFVPVHALSTVLSAVFCTSGVVLLYQLCLAWFGRERLDNLMTASQVLVTVGAVAASQAIPYIMPLLTESRSLAGGWWVPLLPPAWFAGFDDALAGSRDPRSWLLAGMGVAATVGLAWAALVRLAASYGEGMQALGETRSRIAAGKGGRRLLDRATSWPPLSWWLRDPVLRQSFLLTAAYLVRDRDVKLRVYPNLAPLLVLPFLLLASRHPTGSETVFGLVLGPAYLALLPAMALNTLQYSQQWQASDVFRAGPIRGPGLICIGAERAVLLLLGVPAIVCFAVAEWLIRGGPGELALMLPAIIAMPAIALLALGGGRCVPLSVPADAAKAAHRGLALLVLMLGALTISGIGYVAQLQGWFWYFVAAEAVIAILLRTGLLYQLKNARWSSME